MKKIKSLYLLLPAILILLLAGCMNENKERDFSDVSIEYTKQEVISSIGEPDKLLGKKQDKYYYVNSETKEAIIIWFNENKVAIKAELFNGGFVGTPDISESYHIRSLYTVEQFYFLEEGMDITDIIERVGFSFERIPMTGNFDYSIRYQLLDGNNITLHFSFGKLDNAVINEGEVGERTFLIY